MRGERHDGCAAESRPSQAEGLHASQVEWEYHRSVLRLLAGKALPDWLKNVESASDLAQEALVAAWLALDEKRNSFSDERDLGAWLHRVLMNKVFDAIRRNTSGKQARRPNVRLEDAPEFPAGDLSPSKVVEDREQLRRLSESMNSLDVFDLQLLIWRFTDDFTYQRIGEQLGVSDVAARKNVIEATKRLKRLYEGHPNCDASDPNARASKPGI
jgi:RNA polymerase sigma factor (sigma-70 family)